MMVAMVDRNCNDGFKKLFCTRSLCIKHEFEGQKRYE